MARTWSSPSSWSGRVESSSQRHASLEEASPSLRGEGGTSAAGAAAPHVARAGREDDAVTKIPDEELRVWLDDDLVDRKPPAGWVHATTAWETIELLGAGRVVELSLDHDLGDDERFGRGIDVIDFVAEQQEIHGRPLWPRDGIHLHTANPVGRETMARSIRNYCERGDISFEETSPGGQPFFRFQ